MKKIFAVLIVLILIFAFSFGASAEGMSWYCKREKDHKQPRADANMSYIENFGGYYVDKNHGDENGDKVVYLTFDAGYENGNVSKILDTLKEEGVTGAFFVLEHLIRENKELVMRMAEEGHTVCNHTCSHRDMTKVTSREDFALELSSLEKIYNETTGYEMTKYYRPPEGRFDEKTLKWADELGFKTIFWSLAYADWDNNKQPTKDYAFSKLLPRIHNGAVLLLHSTSKTNAEILDELLTRYKEMGYQFASLDALFS